MRGFRVTACAVLCLASAACSRREQSYSQETPDDVVRSAVAMVKNGDAARLDDLIYAENDRMRAVLARLGELLGRMQGLARAVGERFPEDLAKLKEQTEEAVKDGRAAEIALSFGRRPGPGQEEAMQNLAVSLLADPYGWLDRNGARLGTVTIADDIASVTLDGKPVLPPIGITLKRDMGRWYIALPTHLPGVSGYMPQTDTEYAIIGSLIRVLDNSVDELTRDVRDGRVGSIKILGDRIGEKAIWPGMITFIAYSREMDVRRRRERMTRQFDKRQREWAKKREEAGSPAPAWVLGAIDAAEAPQLDKLARKDKRPNLEQIPEPEFVELVEGMLAAEGLTLSLTDPADPALEATVAQWQADRAKAKGTKPKR